MREFTQDEQGRIDSLGATDSPSACFQSQFAREVVRNTRQSSSTVVQDHSHNHHSVVMGSNPRNSSIENSMASTLTSNSTNNGGNPSTSYYRNRKSLTAYSGYRSQFAAKHHQANQQPGQDDDSE